MTLSEPFQKPTHDAVSQPAGAWRPRSCCARIPADGAVLMGGCDKTTPALLMGAISMNLPAIFMPGGPMLRGNWRGQTLGSRHRHLEILGRAARRQHQRRASGRRSKTASRARPALHDDGHGVDDDRRRPRRSASRCPAPRRFRQPIRGTRGWRPQTGRRIVDMVWEDLKPRDILTAASFDNAITAVLALGGSTNAIVHLIAMARPRRHSADARSLRRAGAQRRRCSPTSARRAST